MKAGRVVLGMIAGAAAGAVLGILFAPDKGSKTRKRILAKGEGYADEVKEKVNELLDTINENYQAIKKETEDLVTKEKAKPGETKDEIKNATV